MNVASAQTLERMLVLRALPAFAGLDDQGLATVAQHCSERIVASGEVLLGQGELMSRTFVVVDGRVRVELDGHVVARSDRRIGVGILGMLAGTDSERSVVADARARLLVLERERLFDVMEEEFGILAHVLRVLAKEIIATYMKLGRDYAAPERPRPTPPHLKVQGRELDLVERILAVRQVPAFGRSSLDSVARYAKLLGERRIAAGDVLWREGEPCHTYLHVVAGVVECSREGSGSVLTYGAPAMPGLFGVLGGREHRWYTATAKTDVVALRVDREVILDMLEDDFEMAARCLTLSARRLIRFLEMRDEAGRGSTTGNRG